VGEGRLLEADVRFTRPGFNLEARFELGPGWTVVFGPSGAGKTTLLRILSGLLAPDRGCVSLRQRVLTDTKARLNVAPGQRRVGFVTQQAALFPHLTGRANVAFGLHGLKREEREARVAEMLELFDAASFADRRPGALSGGEQQRIALARALAPQPELLLLDEPFAALDLATKSAVVEKLQASRVPVLYVSHALADAWQMNANAIVMEAGQIKAQGQARDVLAPYRDRLLEQLGAGAVSEARLGA
jgi:ABC-type sulfate/molybdate transport systems ATPase subunit